MKLPKSEPQLESARDLARMLAECGASLNGRNLRKSSWSEIADCLLSSNHLRPIIWQRLQAVKNREDVLRVLRIVRKQKKQRLSPQQGKNRSSHRHETRQAVETATVDDSEDLEDCSFLPCAISPDKYWDDYSEEDLSQKEKPSLATLQVINNFLWTCEQSGRQPDRSIKGTQSVRTDKPKSLETRLTEHLRLVHSGIGDRNFECRLVDSIGSLKNLDVVRSAVDDDLLTSICLFSPFWIRDPSSWDGDVPIFEHLFVRYPVPRVLNSCWSRPLQNSSRHIEPLTAICWFIVYAQGGSLQRAGNALAGEYYSWNVNKKLQQVLHDSPTHLTIEESVALARIKLLGGTEGDFIRLNRAPLEVPETVKLPINNRYEKRSRSSDPKDVCSRYLAREFYFWVETARWFIANREQIGDHDVTAILSWATHSFIEAARRSTVRFTWKGRTPASTIRRAREYHQLIAQKQSTGDLSWAPRGLTYELVDDSHAWTFVELTSEAELFEEGCEHNHCVATYARSSVRIKTMLGRSVDWAISGVVLRACAKSAVQAAKASVVILCSK